jgi:hypothetical protein
VLVRCSPGRASVGASTARKTSSSCASSSGCRSTMCSQRSSLSPTSRQFGSRMLRGIGARGA